MTAPGNISPTGNPFDRTMMMMEIDKRDLEISDLKNRLEFSMQNLSETVQVLQRNAETFQKAADISDPEWQDFLSMTRQYCGDIAFDLFNSDSVKLLVSQFLRYKIGSAVLEKIK